MKKNIKKNVSILTLVFTLLFGFQISAEENTGTMPRNFNRPSQEEREKGEFKQMMKENKLEREGMRQEFKNRFGEIKDDLKNNREQYKLEVDKVINSIKEQRQEFKSEMETNREQMREKLSEMKIKLKDDLKNIKDENKQKTTENIVDLIQELNKKITDNFVKKVDQIENVLISIESRIKKAQDNGINVSSVESKVEIAKSAIDSAREAIKTQSSKVYQVNITNESTLRMEMEKLRDTFRKDINIIRELVKKAHMAVKDVVNELAKIPKIDNETIDTNNN